jgi:hypothetical protein
MSDRPVAAAPAGIIGQDGGMKLLAAELMGKVRAAPGDIVPALARSLETAKTFAAEGFSSHPDSQSGSEPPGRRRNRSHNQAEA